MSNKQGGMQRFLKFMAGKGFYVVLLLCVVAIGVSGYMLFFRTADDGGEDLTLSRVSPNPTLRPAPTAPAVPSAPVGTSPTPSTQMPRTTAPVSVQTPAPTPTPDKPVIGPAEIPSTEDDPVTEITPPPQQPANNDFFWPVRGAVLGAYTGTAMAFSETMQDWRAHPGLDIETGPNASVMASADGEVTQIENDPYYGTIVTITHANGYISRYGNLQKTVSVEPGEKVKAGHIIGGIGETAAVESSLQEHLHFEILKDGKQVNPLDLLPDQS